MACDSMRQRIVLFGGGAHRPYQDTWEWNGTAWSQRSVALHPPFNNGHAMAFDEARGREELGLLRRLPGFADLPCARSGRVHVMDGVRLFSRPGPSLVDSLERLAAVLGD